MSGMSTKKQTKKRSLSTLLTFLLVLTVAVVFVASSWIIHSLLSQNEYAQLERKADDFIASIDDVLEIPLWNMDVQNIQKIARAYSDNDLFERIRIYDDLGDIYFDFSRNREALTVKRSTDIFHEGQTVGHIEIAFTTKGLVHRNLGLLFSSLGVFGAVIFTLVLVTGFFLKTILKKLFYRLNRISDAYATGRDVSSDDEIPYLEFQPLLRILEEMRDKLNGQIEDIQAAEKKYRSIFENAVDGIYQTTPDGRFVNANPAMARMLGYDSPRALIEAVTNIGRQLYLDPEKRQEYVRLSRTEGEVSNFHIRVQTADGKTAWLALHSRPIHDSSGELVLIEGMAQDITRRKVAEEERVKLEQQLLHSQKLESVGRLAGGVAHDFNNMLSIILGYTEMILEKMSPDDPDHAPLQEIRSAASRSAELTRQLLAFARKQTVQPKTLNLNDTILGAMKMLQRLVEENITLSFSPGENLQTIHIDPTQLDQILVNLCINAKDAIGSTGYITISTGAVSFEQADCLQHPDMEPGSYVVLSVSDDGCGMDELVRSSIFEPFFTTKGIAKGTGLGLSTIYGIVKQNHGNIYVYSEPGKGTTFKIYLPTYTDPADLEHAIVDSEKSLIGRETVLLVEDEAALLALSRQTLEQLGYTVLATESPAEALRIAADYPEKIDLLMTDVIMPEMNGRDLATRLAGERPEIRCLYVSGYTTDIIAPHVVLEEGDHFIDKPFSRKVLATRLREILA